MTEKDIKNELELLSNKEYQKQKERVFEFLNLFSKSNSVKWYDEQIGSELSINKKGKNYTYRTLIFSIADEYIVKNLYCRYRKVFLLKVLEQIDKEFAYSRCEQLSLF